MKAPAPNSPPRARLAFRVGVVGHRPNRLPRDEDEISRLRLRIASVLEAVKEAVDTFKAEHADAAFYADQPPLLCAVSPLAEGSDRIVAQEAMKLGYALCCPMPFAQSEYEQDFDVPSREHFRALLDQARSGAGLTVFQLDAERGDADTYGPAGRIVLNQSDLLVVVWDGDEPKGPGGTVDTLREAIGFHLPVLGIDARAPFGWSVVRETADLANFGGREPGPELAAAISEIVTAELALAAPDDDNEQPPCERAIVYFAEQRPRHNMGFLWKPFRNLVGSASFTAHQFRVGDFVEAIATGWPVSGDPKAPDPPPRVTSWVNASLRAHYAWSDKLADLCADAHRSTFVATALLAVAAVLFALIPVALGLTPAQLPIEAGLIVGELLILTVLIGLSQRAHARRWHQRWMEYRVVAELIRQLRFMIPLGGGHPLPRAPAHLKLYGDPARSWMYWHVRAIARAAGIPEAVSNGRYAGECLTFLQVRASNQRSFHEDTGERDERIHHRLRSATLVLFSLTILAILFHLGLSLGGARVEAWAPHGLGGTLVLLSAFLPALGAALASINNQGEFVRLAKRSRSMADGFRRFEAEIAGLSAKLAGGGNPPRMAEVTDVAGRMARMMVDEVIDWRVVVLDLPHAAG